MNLRMIGLCLSMVVCVVLANESVPLCNTKGFKVIPKLDCKGYYICVLGRPVEMPNCPKGSMFSTGHHVCVPTDSVYNDCKIDVTPTIPNEGPKTIDERCARDGGLISHPTECHAYYNCSHKYEFVPRFFEQYLQECPYPELFNTKTMSCDHFENVKCGSRVELKNGCKYRQNMCGSAHCIPCSVWLPSCERKSDGVNVHESKLWSPYYAMCYKERTLGEKSCTADVNGRTQLFHPELNQCVSLDRIPKEHGGMMSDCTGHSNGFYIDDFGRCNQYTVCKDGKFLTNIKCPPGEVFDDKRGICIDVSRACGTCGNRADCYRLGRIELISKVLQSAKESHTAKQVLQEG